MKNRLINIVRIRHIYTLLFYAISCLYSNIAIAEWNKEQQNIMGTEIRVEFWLEDPITAQRLLKKIMAEMHRIDALMSPHKKNSELSKINQQAANHELVLSNEMYHLITKSLEISALSDGAFDITFASIGNLYNYRKHIKPSAKQIQNHLDKINYKHIILNPKNNSIRFAKQGVVIDLGGIAKGHAVDNSIKILKNHQVKHGLVSAGGDTRIIGDHHGRPWITAIRAPRNRNKTAILLPLSDIAISTSGDYERFFIDKQIRYHHIISPKTGDSSRSVQSVSVIGPNSTRCDALSTTLFVLGQSKALKLINQIANYDAIIIDSDGKLIFSSGLQKPPKLSRDKNR